MSIINELRSAEAAFAAAQARLEALRENPQLKQLQEFEGELRALLGKYSMSLVDVNTLLDPNFKAPKNKANNAQGKSHKSTGAAAQFEFKNPHTGETVVAANILKRKVQEWIHQYGKEEVLTWRTQLSA